MNENNKKIIKWDERKKNSKIRSDLIIIKNINKNNLYLSNEFALRISTSLCTLKSLIIRGNVNIKKNLLPKILFDQITWRNLVYR